MLLYQGCKLKIVSKDVGEVTRPLHMQPMRDIKDGNCTTTAELEMIGLAIRQEFRDAE